MAIYDLYRKQYRLVLIVAIVASAGVILLGTWLKEQFELVGLALQQTGVAGVVASSVSVAFAEYYRSLRRENVRNELGDMIAELKFAFKEPSRIANIEPLLGMREAGVTAFYPTRKGPATEQLMDRLEKLQSVDEEVVVGLLGDTLRVFFHPGSDFTHQVYELITERSNIRFQVLVMDPLCRNAVYRSQAETPNSFAGLEDYRRRSGLYNDSTLTARTIEAFNAQARQAHGQSPIELRFYDCADCCVLVRFPDSCFTSQYIYGDEMAQVHTIRLPMLVFESGSPAWTRYTRHFNVIWDLAKTQADLGTPEERWQLVAAWVDEVANAASHS